MKNKGFIIEAIAVLTMIGIFSLIGIIIYKNISFGTKQREWKSYKYSCYASTKLEY